MTAGRISRAVVADRVALVRRLLDEAGTLPLDDFDDFVRDSRMVAAGESYLRRALEALLDVARHVLAKGFARGPSEYAEVARKLGEVRVVSREQSGAAWRRRHRAVGGRDARVPFARVRACGMASSPLRRRGRDACVSIRPRLLWIGSESAGCRQRRGGLERCSENVSRRSSC